MKRKDTDSSLSSVFSMESHLECSIQIKGNIKKSCFGMFLYEY